MFFENVKHTLQNILNKIMKNIEDCKCIFDIPPM